MRKSYFPKLLTHKQVDSPAYVHFSRKSHAKTVRVMETERNRPVNAVYFSDCLFVMRSLPAESVDLVYLDPPFCSNRNYSALVKGCSESLAFSDRWEGGIEQYTSWMTERISECRRILKKTGSIFLHCDPHSSHYLKVALDRVFGRTNFRNEIVWKRQGGHNDSRQGARLFGKIHDTILFYSKTSDLKWCAQYKPYSERHIERAYRFVEPGTSRRFALGDLTGPGGSDKGSPRFKFLGVTRFWRYNRRTMMKLYKQGRIVQTSNSTLPYLKRYLDEMNGVELQDIWDDIKPVLNSRERANYPTQKPVELIQRIIGSCTAPGDLVLDPFVGSGTTAVACHNLSRNWIAIDSSIKACRVTLRRLHTAGVMTKIILPDSKQIVKDLLISRTPKILIS